MIFCRTCHLAIRRDLRYCPYCGRRQWSAQAWAIGAATLIVGLLAVILLIEGKFAQCVLPLPLCKSSTSIPLFTATDMPNVADASRALNQPTLSSNESPTSVPPPTASQMPIMITPRSSLSTVTPKPIPPISTAAPSIKPNCSISVSSKFGALWDKNWNVLGCPIDNSAIVSPACEQPFEGGHLFWRSDTTRIYIVFDNDKNNGIEINSGDWFIGRIEWGWDGSNPNGVGLKPPAGRYEPIGGLGWIWRQYLDGPNGRLGWATGKEYCFDKRAIAQSFQNGLIYQSSDPKIYALGFNNRFEALR